MKVNFFLGLIVSALSVGITYFILSQNENWWLSIIGISCLLFSLAIFLFGHDISYLLLFFIVTNNFSYVPGAAFFHILFLGITAAFIPFVYLSAKPANRLNFFLPIILIISYYSVIFALRPFVIKSAWVIVHLETLIFFIIVQTISWDSQKIFKIIKLYLGFLLVYGVIEHFAKHATRIEGPMFSATGFGVTVAIVWSIWFSYSLFKKNYSYFTITAITLICINTMLWTGTRMTVIGIATAIFLTIGYLIIKSKMSVLIKSFILVILPITIISSVFLLWNFLPDTLIIKKSFSTILEGKIDSSNMGRIVGWYGGYHAFLNHPMFGIGNGNFLVFLQNYLEKQNIDVNMLGIQLVPHAHNLFLIILSENGIFGFVILFSIIGMSLFNLITYTKQTKQFELYSLVIGAFVLAALGLFDSIPFYPTSKAWGAWFIAVMLQLPKNVQGAKLT